jgi:invasion protein IalB
MMNTSILIAALAATPATATVEAGAKPVAYNDWMLVCSKREALPPCEIVQRLQSTDNAEIQMQASLAYAGRDDRYAIQFKLPLGLFVQPETLLRLDETKNLPNYRITRCERQGCFIDRLLASNDLEPLLGAQKGVLAVAQTNGTPLAFSISFNGFAPALKAMVERNKSWAATIGSDKKSKQGIEQRK